MGPGAKRLFTMEEVAKHNTKGDCWLVVGKNVYDATRWVERHPGGELTILNCGGMDATDPMWNNHHPRVMEKILPRYQIGKVVSQKVSKEKGADSEGGDSRQVDGSESGGSKKTAAEESKSAAAQNTSGEAVAEDGDDVSALTRDYRQMIKDFERAGMFETDYRYYVKLGVWYATLLAASIFCVLRGETPFVRVALGGFLMGFFFQQVAFLGHDLGHNGVTHERKWDVIMGATVGNLLTGISMGWWKATHNVHHLVTNSVVYDPDIQHLPVFAVTPAFFNDVFSKYHFFEFPFRNSKITHWFISHQHWLYHLIMGVARFNLYAQSFILLLSPRAESRRRGIQNPNTELLLLSGFWVWFGSLVWTLPSLGEVLGFLLLSHFVAGLLHVQITISHFPMDIYEGDDVPLAQEPEFFAAQLKTTMDVDCPAWMDWFHGGLQFQVVHHLMPRMPRHNLRKASKFVQSLAEKHGLVYKSVGFIEANCLVLQTLRKTAGKVHPFLIEGLNAAG